MATRSGVSDSSGPVAAEAALGAAMGIRRRSRPHRLCMARKCTYAGSPTKPPVRPAGQPAGAGAGVHIARTAAPASVMIDSATRHSTPVPQPQSWETPKASELFTQCRAMHGYSEPVR